MHEQLVRITRTAVGAVFLLFGAGACDSSPEIPTAPDGPIPFNAVAINANTLQPTPGTSLNAGSSGNTFHADVAYQITTEEFNEAGNPLFVFWLETWSSGGDLWEGDLRQEFVFADQQTGVRTFEGTFNVPTISPFCTGYSEFAVAVWLLTATEPPSNDPNLNPDDDKTAASSTLERVFMDVSGASGTTANCMQHMVWHPNVPWWWGESIIFWARNIDPAANIQFTVGPNDMPADMITSGHFENGESGYVVWLPPAGDGQVAMWVDGVEVGVYGADRQTSIDYDGDEDIFWYNDDFESAAFDWIADSWFIPEVFIWNPNLSIHAPEQEVDADANPLASTTWMKGDWMSVWLNDIDSATSVNVCSWIFFDGADDLDLLIFDDQGNLLDSSTQTGTTSEMVRVDGVAGGTELRLWIAPFSLGTASGVYEVISADCSLFGLSAGAMTDAPDPGGFLTPGARARMESIPVDARNYALTGADARVATTGQLKDELEIR